MAIVAFVAGYLVPIGIFVWSVTRAALAAHKARYAYLLAIAGIALLLVLLFGFSGGGGIVGLFGLAATVIGLGLGGWWDRMWARMVNWTFLVLLVLVAFVGIY